MKVQLHEGGGRILLGDNTTGGLGHAAAGKVPVCWSLDFSRTPFYLRIADFRNVTMTKCRGMSELWIYVFMYFPQILLYNFIIFIR
jgi:hypothetical protein